MREVVVDTAGCNGAWVEWGRGRERVVSDRRGAKRGQHVPHTALTVVSARAPLVAP